MRKGDEVEIIDEKHCGFGTKGEIVMTQFKRGKRTYKVDDVDNKVGYWCKIEQLKKL